LTCKLNLNLYTFSASLLILTQRLDRCPRLRLHLHPAHSRGNRLLVRARFTSMDIPRNPSLQIDILGPLFRDRHRHHSRGKSYRLRPHLAILEAMASSWHGCIPRSDARSSHLRLSGCPQVPSVWAFRGYVFRKQDVPQGRGVGSERCSMVFTRGFTGGQQGMRRCEITYLINDMHSRLHPLFLPRLSYLVIMS
jgi:hypothetical protein